jgi:hypothetical protein
VREGQREAVIYLVNGLAFKKEGVLNAGMGNKNFSGHLL